MHPDVARAFEEALRADEDRRWELVTHLHVHGGREALGIAARLGRAAEPSRRELAAEVLGQLGTVLGTPGPDPGAASDPGAAPDGGGVSGHRASPGRSAADGPFRDEATALLVAMIAREDDPAVLYSLAVALGHMAGEDSVAPLVRLRAHPDADVRGGVVFGLLGRETRAALDALIELSADVEPGVRDWATFGLARQSDADFPALREALAARLDDDDTDTRAEAVHGLAVRGDERAMPQLLSFLADPDPVADLLIIFEALCELAAATGDPRLLPYLEAELSSYTGEPPEPELLRALERYGRFH
ncbi:HEAT repeat domain-containing protein [Dactylosporangium sp. NPDC049742]|uniref:HEAT repeat domain-containing protein n=1 Tax=Dactylosporangium sp. NPDC049742 TaxID=3154737 RepID=UPI0034122183